MDTPSSGHQPVPLDPRLAPKKSMFVLEDGRNVLFVFPLLILLFALWGFCNGMIDAMDKHFQDAQGFGKRLAPRGLRRLTPWRNPIAPARNHKGIHERVTT